MFFEGFGFGGGDFGLSQPPDSNELSQETLNSTRSGPRELDPGIIPTPIATLLNASGQGKFADGKTELYGREWTSVIIVGFLEQTDETDGILTGQISDGTGSMAFRYELKDNYTTRYRKKIDATLPPDENSADKIQVPARLIGSPQVIDNELCLMAGHLRPTEYEDVAYAHFLDAAAIAIELKQGGPTVERIKTVEIQPGDLRAVGKDLDRKDPYDNEEIVVEDASVAAFVKDDRLKLCIYRYLLEKKAKNLTGDASESTLAIKAFCKSAWTGEEVMKALDELDEHAVLFYEASDKLRVSLL